MATGRKWTGDELLVALNLYRKLSFGNFTRVIPSVLPNVAHFHGEWL